jgi:hypothetical protein
MPTSVTGIAVMKRGSFRYARRRGQAATAQVQVVRDQLPPGGHRSPTAVLLGELPPAGIP